MSRRRNNLIRVQRKTEASDPFTDEDPDWSDLFGYSLYALIEPAEPFAQRREYQSGPRMETQVTHVITLSYTPEITTKDRVLFGERIFQIAVVTNEDERNRRTRLLCLELT